MSKPLAGVPSGEQFGKGGSLITDQDAPEYQLWVNEETIRRSLDLQLPLIYSATEPKIIGLLAVIQEGAYAGQKVLITKEITREEAISSLHILYPELTRRQIADEAYQRTNFYEITID